MGEGEPGQRGEHGGRDGLTVAAELERWTDHGAQWRALEVSDELAVVQLCTCYGEPVDLVEGRTPDLIAYVREHRDDAGA